MKGQKVDLLILFPGKFPTSSAASKRFSLYIRGLEENGIKVGVITMETNSLLNVLNSFLRPFKIVGRIKNKFWQVKNILIYTRSWWLLFVISMYSKIAGCRIFIEMNEKPGAPYSNRLLELKIVKAFDNFMLVNFAFKFVNGFIVISDPLYNFISRFKSSKARIIKVPILIDAYAKDNLASTFEENMERPFILHAGSLSERKDGIVKVFEAFAIACKTMNYGLHFYLTSRVAPERTWKKINKIIADSAIANNIHFLGDVSEERLNHYQRQCALVIINKPDNTQNRFNFATKLGEYLVLGKPIIASKVGEMVNFLKDGVHAILVEANDSAQIAQAILRILEDTDLVAAFKSNNNLLAKEQFDYRIHGKRLADFINT